MSAGIQASENVHIAKKKMHQNIVMFERSGLLTKNKVYLYLYITRAY